MRNPNSPTPPRLTAPVPLPAGLARGDFAGASVVYDLDRCDELPWASPRLLAPYQTAADPDADPATVAGQGREMIATLAAYLCVGVVGPEGAILAGAPDDVPAWVAVPRRIVTWVLDAGLTAARRDPDAPEDAPAQEADAADPLATTT